MAFTPDELTQIHRTVGAMLARREPPEHLRALIRHELEIGAQEHVPRGCALTFA